MLQHWQWDMPERSRQIYFVRSASFPVIRGHFPFISWVSLHSHPIVALQHSAWSLKVQRSFRRFHGLSPRAVKVAQCGKFSHQARSVAQSIVSRSLPFDATLHDVPSAARFSGNANQKFKGVGSTSFTSTILKTRRRSLSTSALRANLRPC